MTALLGSIEVVLSVNYDRFQSEMRNSAAAVEQQTARMDRAVRGAGKGVEGLAKSTQGVQVNAFRTFAQDALKADDNVKRLRFSMLSLAGLGGGFGGAFAAKALVETADAYANIQNRLRVITDDAKSRNALEMDLFNLSQRTRSGLEDTVKLYSRIDLALGGSVDKADKLRFAEVVTKSFAVSGMTPAEQSSSILEITHGLDSGRIQARTLRPLLMENVALGRVLAQQMSGGDLSKLRDMAEHGEITSERFIRAIIAGGREIDSQFAKVAPTVSSSLTVMSNALTQFVGRADQGVGASHSLAEGIIWLADHLDMLGDHAVAVGKVLALVFASRFFGAGASNLSARFGDAAKQARDDVEAAKTSLEAAQADHVDRLVDHDDAVNNRRTLAQQPRFMQASPVARSDWSKAQSTLDSLEEAVTVADAKRNAAIEKRIALEAEEATASPTALKRVQAATMALAGEEQKLNALIARRLELEAAADLAGGTVDRRRMQGVYNALAEQVDAANHLEQVKGTQSFLAAHGTALTTLRDLSMSTGDIATAATAQTSLGIHAAATQEATDQRINAMRRVADAEKALAAQEAAITAAQMSEKERATLVLARQNAAIETSQNRLIQLAEREARARQAADDAIIASNQRKMAAIARQDTVIAGARQSRDVAAAQIPAARIAVTETRAAVDTSAQENMRKAVSAEYGAFAELSRAEREEGDAVAMMAAKTNAARAPQIALSGAVGLLKGGLSSLVGFLGGPWGVAFVLGMLALENFGSSEAEAAEASDRTKRSLDALTTSTNALTDARQRGTVAAQNAAEAEAKASLAGTQRSIEEVRGRLQDQVNKAQGQNPVSDFSFNLFQDSSSGFDGLDKKAIQLVQDLIDGKAKAEDVKAALDQMAADGSAAAASLSASLRGDVSQLANLQAQAQAATTALRNMAATQEAAVRVKIAEYDAPGAEDPFHPSTAGSMSSAIKAKIADYAAPSAADSFASLNKKVVDHAPAADRAAGASHRLAAAHRDAGGAAKQAASDHETFAQALTDLRQRASIAGLSQFNQQVVSAAQSIGFTNQQIDELIAKLNASDGTSLTGDLKTLFDAEQKIDDAKFGREELDKAKLSAETYADDLAKLQRLLALGPANNGFSQAQYDKAKATLDKSQDDGMGGKIAESLTSQLDGVIMGTTKVKDAFRSMLSSIEKDILDAAVTNPLKTMMTSWFSGAFGGTGASGGVGGFFSSLFGGGGLSNPFSLLNLGQGGIGHNATGTDNWAGGMTWVGESGPELMDVPAHTAIATHDASMAAMTRVPTVPAEAMASGPGGMGGRQTINFNVTSPDAPSFARSEGQMSALLSRAVGRGQRYA